MRPPETACRLLASALADEATLISFVQQGLGCGCPPEVIRTGRLKTACRPLRDYLVRETKKAGWEGLRARLSALVGLPQDAPWPEPPEPWGWRAAQLKALPPALARLKRLCSARANLLIDVPGRALFVVAASQEPPGRAALEELHASCSLVKDLAGYNRIRLFTLSDTPAQPLPVVDTALTWQAVVGLLRSRGAAQAAAAISAALTSV